MTDMSVSVEDCIELLTDEAAARQKARHDIHASLAISLGFTNALKSSFDELCQMVQQTHASSDSDVPVEMSRQLYDLEADCRFCLSRIEKSLEQLCGRIGSNEYPANSANSSGPDVQ